MRKKFDEQLDDLSQEMIYMGNLIEQAIENAVDALIHKNVEKAENIINSDDKIDNQERKIENLCLHLLLQQQPVAKDLRLISSTLKMITDMERIGDHATDIAELTIEMANQPYIKKLEHIEQMAKEIILMLINCLKAYVTRDVLTAENVIKHDDKVDKFTKLDKLPSEAKDYTDKTFYVDVDAKEIHVFTDKFSTYAVSYNEIENPKTFDSMFGYTLLTLISFH